MTPPPCPPRWRPGRTRLAFEHMNDVGELSQLSRLTKAGSRGAVAADPNALPNANRNSNRTSYCPGAS